MNYENMTFGTIFIFVLCAVLGIGFGGIIMFLGMAENFGYWITMLGALGFMGGGIALVVLLDYSAWKEDRIYEII